MSDIPPRAGLGLSDLIIDPEILTKEIDHDFFDDPPEAIASIDFKDCQQQLKANLEMPNKNRRSFEGGANGVSSSPVGGARLEKGRRKSRRDQHDELNNESGRSSSNLTVHLEMDKGLLNGGKRVDGQENIEGSTETEAEFYTIHQSNATSPNYPRPKQCYQLQQKRRSLGSIRREFNLNGVNLNGSPSIHPVNVGDCDLDGMFADDEMLSSSSEEESRSHSSESDSDLSDSTESELDSLASEDDEFVDMLGKYFDYIEDDSDCSDLTEVSPLSSLNASPLPPLYVGGEGEGGFDGLLRIADITLDEEDNCSSTGYTGFDVESEKEGLSFRAADIVYDRSAGDQVELKVSEYVKPKLPLFISTTESIIVPENGLEGKDEEDEEPATDLEELAGEQKEGIVYNKVESVSNAEKKEDPSAEDNGSGVTIVAQSKDISDDGTMASFNFSTSSVPVKEENFSRSSSSTAGWSLSSSGGATGETGGLNSSSSISATSSSGSSRGSGNGGKRPPKNFTFTPEQMRKIERENHILLRKILDANSRGQHFHPRHRTGHHGHHARHHHKPFSTTSARLRQQKRIEHENNILMKRLQSVKPSKEIVEAFEKPVGKN